MDQRKMPSKKFVNFLNDNQNTGCQNRCSEATNLSFILGKEGWLQVLIL